MMYAIDLPWELTNDTLMWAIESNCHLRITVRMAREWTEVASQFIGGEPLKNILVRQFQAPWTEHMLAGHLLPCSFRKGHKKFLFVSAVLEQREIQTDQGPERAFVLAWPEGIQQVQRRLYYRAHVPSKMNLRVNFWHGTPAVDIVAPDDPPLACGQLVDISAGGAQIQMDRPDALEVNRSYLMEIDLPKPEKPVMVLGQTRRIHSDLDSGRYAYGLQFLSLDQSPRGRETLMKLARFANYLRNFQPMETRRKATNYPSAE